MLVTFSIWFSNKMSMKDTGNIFHRTENHDCSWADVSSEKRTYHLETHFTRFSKIFFEILYTKIFSDFMKFSTIFVCLLILSDLYAMYNV